MPKLVEGYTELGGGKTQSRQVASLNLFGHRLRDNGGEIVTQFLFRLDHAADEFRLTPDTVRVLGFLIVLFICRFYRVLVKYAAPSRVTRGILL